MSQLNKTDFATKYSANTGAAAVFKDNTTEDIGADDVRSFADDIKDSFLSISDNFIDEDDFSSDSATKVPSQQSVKQYIADQIDGTLLGIYNDRGNHDASGNTFPSTGGSGTAGAILKGDIWTISVAGTLGGQAVQPGDTVRALVDTPGSTSSNWAIAETNIGYVPENVANKSTSTSLGTSNILYPSQNAVKEYVDGAKTYDGTQTFMPGTTAAVPIVLQSGTAATTPVNGALEYHNSHLYFTIGSTRYQIDGSDSDLTILRTKVSLSAAQIKTMYSSPVTLLAAPGAGQYIQVLTAYFKKTYGTTQFNFPSGAFGLITGSGNIVNATSPSYTDLNSTSNLSYYFHVNSNSFFNDMDDRMNQPLQFTFTSGGTGDATTGDSTGYWVIYYKISDFT